MNEQFSPSPWSNELTFMTIISLVLIIGVIISLGFLYAWHSKYLIYTIPCSVAITILVVTILVGVALMPLGVSRSEKGIAIHLLAKKIIIPEEEINTIETYPIEENTCRIYGAAGFFGYIGLFRNDKLGIFDSYATDFNKSYVIQRKSKRPIVVTVANPSVLEKFIKN